MTPPKLRHALFGEFLGTALLVLLGDGVVASVFLLDKKAEWLMITTGWGLAVALAVYVSGRLGGGHLNPAVTLALAVRRDFAWPRVAPYWAAQLAGAFVGALIVYVDFAEAFHSFEQTHAITRGLLIDGKLAGPAAGGAGVFTNFPAFDTLWRNLFSEVVGTSVLLLVVRSLSDPRNTAPDRSLTPLLTGLVVWSIGLSLGGLTGYAINPARDLGPRLATTCLGWGLSAFQSHSYYFWVPIVGPLIGGVLGALLYDLGISPYLPPVDEPGSPGRNPEV